MIDLNDLEEDIEYTIDDIGGKAVELLRRQLYSLARKHNQTSLELENIKTWSGFYTKPFSFLLLPPRNPRPNLHIHSPCPLPLNRNNPTPKRYLTHRELPFQTPNTGFTPRE
jgi:hypothetical protein